MLWNEKVEFERNYCFPSLSYHCSIPDNISSGLFCDGYMVRL